MTVYRGLPRGIANEEIRPYLENDINYINLEKQNQAKQLLSMQQQAILGELHLIHEEADPLAERLFFLQLNRQWSDYDDLYNELVQESQQGNLVAIAALNRTIAFSKLFPKSVGKNKESAESQISNIEAHRLVQDKISTASTEKWFNRFFVFCLALALIAFVAVGKIGTGLTSELFLPLVFISIARSIFFISRIITEAKERWQNVVKLISSLLFIAVGIIFALHFVSISSVAGQFSLPYISSVFLFAPAVLLAALTLELIVLNYNVFKNRLPNRGFIALASVFTLFFTVATVFSDAAIFSIVAAYASPLAILSGATALLINYIDKNTLNTVEWGKFIIEGKIPLWQETLTGISEDIQKLKQKLSVNIANLPLADLERIETRLAYLQNQIEIIRLTIDTLPTAPGNVRAQLMQLSNQFGEQLKEISQQRSNIANKVLQRISNIALTTGYQKNQDENGADHFVINAFDVNPLDKAARRNTLSTQIAGLESLNRLLTAMEEHHVTLPPDSKQITTIRSEYNNLISTLNQERTELSKQIMQANSQAAEEKKSAKVENTVQAFLSSVETDIETLRSGISSSSSSLSMSSSLSSASSLSLDRLSELSNIAQSLQQTMAEIDRNIQSLDIKNATRQQYGKSHGELNQTIANAHIAILQQAISQIESNLSTMGINPSTDKLALLQSLESKYVLLAWNKRLINADVSNDVQKQNKITAEILSVEVKLEYANLPQLTSSTSSSSATSQTNQHRVDALRSISSRFSRLSKLTNGEIPEDLRVIHEAVEKELAPPASSGVLEVKRS